MRHPNTITPTQALLALKEQLQEHITTAPILLDGLPAQGDDYYTLTHTAGTMGQIQRGIITINFWGKGINPRPEEEQEMVRATNALPTAGGIVWTLKDLPTTTYLHQDNYTIIAQRVEYQLLTD